MSHITTFPHFVADQVLTADHLNEMFDYLEEQERLTRSHLIGIGIVCGLELTYNGASITISKGCGITSAGYLVIPETQAGQAVPQVGNIAFPWISGVPYVFSDDMKDMAPYKNWSAAFELLPAKKDNSDRQISASAAFMADYAVVLLLEKKTTDLKNCTTNDCDDKGERVDLVVKPLLVKKSDLTSYKYFGFESEKLSLPEIPLKRFNVPFAKLQSPTEVLNAFLTITNSATIDAIALAYNKAYTTFQPLLGGMANPFGNLKAVLNAEVNTVKSNYSLYIQYIYDFIDDLIKAYHELRELGTDILVECCPDEGMFPLHLMLGEATKSTSAGATEYRHRFIYSPIFNKQKEMVKALQLLFRRMQFLVSDQKLEELAKVKTATVRITPSQWGKEPLSARAIPYYYNSNNLFKYWNYQLSSRGRERNNLSYNAIDYATLDQVKSPLNYDIEPYNFYRIEGHIGYDYQKAMVEIGKRRQDFNLPFDLIALNVRAAGGNIDPEDVQCYFHDLESQYNVLISELLCKLHFPACFIAKLPFMDLAQFGGKETGFAFDMKKAQMARKARFNSFGKENPVEFQKRSAAGAAGDQAMGAAGIVKDEAADGFVKDQGPDDNMKEYMGAMFGGIKTTFDNITLTGRPVTVNVQKIRADAAKTESFIMSLRGKTYKKGTFLSRYCSPAKDTVGAKYIADMKKGKASYPAPGAPPSTQNILLIAQYFYAHYFYFIDTVEELIEYAAPKGLSAFNCDDFKEKYDVVMEEAQALALLLILFVILLEIQAENNDDDNVLLDDLVEAVISFIVSELQILTHLCMDTRLCELRSEYDSRLKQLQLDRIFSTYSEQHRGVEHKAGVPRGGTFILVYTETDQNFILEESDEDGFEFLEDKGIVEAKELKAEEAEGDQVVFKEKAETAKSAKAGFKKDSSQRKKTGGGIVEFIKQEQEKLTQAEKDKLEAALDVISGKASLETFAVGNGIVFADFYLPYSCCSGCTPISYIIQEVKPDPVKPTVDITPKDFCKNDPGTYSIIAVPAGGALTAAPGVDIAGFKFTPKDAVVGQTVIKYTLDSQESTVIVNVANPKDASFDFKKPIAVNAAGDFLVEIIPHADAATASNEWYIDGVLQAGTSSNPVFVFPLADQGKTKNIRHVLKSGPCTSEATVAVLLPVPEQPKVSLPVSEFCSSEAKQTPVPITVTPAGGDLVASPGVDVVNKIFQPGGLAPGTYTITYKAFGLTGTATVTIFATPAAGFDHGVELISTGFRLTLKPDNLDPSFSHKWFEDKNVTEFSTSQSPVKDYPFSMAGQKVNIRHEATNGICKDETNTEITFPQLPNASVSLSATQICNTADNSIVTITTAPAGGSLSSVPQVNLDAVNQFDAAKLAAGTYVFTYTVPGHNPATAQILVLEPPTRDFDIKVQQNAAANGFTVTLTALGTGTGVTHLWFENGNLLTGLTGPTLTRSYPASLAGTTIQFGHNVNTGVCTFPGALQKPALLPQLQTASISLSGKLFCNNTSTVVSVVTSPAGGQLTVSPNIPVTNNQFNTLGLNGGVYTFTYTVPGIPPVSDSLTIQLPMNSGFTHEVVNNAAGGFNVNFKADADGPGVQHSWFQGAASTPFSTLANPTLFFPGPGSIPIRHQVVNGSCTGSVTNTVVLENAVNDINVKTVICGQQSTAQLQPLNTGDKVTIIDTGGAKVSQQLILTIDPAAIPKNGIQTFTVIYDLFERATGKSSRVNLEVTVYLPMSGFTIDFLSPANGAKGATGDLICKAQVFTKLGKHDWDATVLGGSTPTTASFNGTGRQFIIPVDTKEFRTANIRLDVVSISETALDCGDSNGIALTANDFGILRDGKTALVLNGKLNFI